MLPEIETENEIEVRHCKNALEFIQILRRNNPLWLGENEWGSRWIFRGQSCLSWSLTPSVWRPSVTENSLFKYISQGDFQVRVDECLKIATIKLLVGSETERVKKWLISRDFEHHSLISFAELIDDLGISLPVWPYPSQLPDNLNLIDNGLPKILPLAALAQHHSIPTNLLDWTANPLVAAFFAAYEKPQNCIEDIAVWALDTFEINRRRQWDGWRIYKVPRSGFGYLHSQEGVFTYYCGSEQYFLQHGSWPTIEGNVPPKSLRQITLPYSQVGDLIRLLWHERISKAHLMPTLDNIVKTNTEIWGKIYRSRVEKEAINLGD